MRKNLPVIIFIFIDRTCFDADTYNNEAEGTCESCSSVCSGGCTGPLEIAGEGGCSQCQVIVTDGNNDQVSADYN